MQALAISLQVQLSSAQNDLTDLRAEKEKLISERDVERQALQDALDAAIIERAENDAKWQRDFEQLRTLNSGKYAQVMIFLLDTILQKKSYNSRIVSRSRRTFATRL